MSNICIKCGAPIIDGAKFCNSCGQPVAVSAQPEAPRCPSCGAELKATSKFCNKCGIEIKKEELSEPKPEPRKPVCPKCGAELKATSKFCNKCGAAVNGEEQEPIPEVAVQTPVCAYCGAELRATSKFCPACGKPAGKEQPEPASTQKLVDKQQLTQTVISTVNTAASNMFRAPNAPGEFALGSVSMIPNTANIISGGFKNILSSFKGFFKNPKALIPTLAITAIWLTLYILRACNISNPFTHVLSILTFSNAGLSSNPLNILGGLLGKGIFAGALVSLVNMFSSIGKGSRRSLGEVVKGSFGFTPDTLWGYILGVGAAILLFVFMSGWVSYYDAAGGIAAAFLAARSALTGGFLPRLLSSFEAKSKVKALQGIPRGLAAGFALGTLLGCIPNCNSWLWIAGAVITLGGAVMLILQKTGTVKLGGKEAAL